MHSEIGRRALKMKYIDGLTLLEISERLDMVYSTFRDNYYKWQKELFADFESEDP